MIFLIFPSLSTFHTFSTKEPNYKYDNRRQRGTPNKVKKAKNPEENLFGSLLSFFFLEKKRRSLYIFIF